VIASLSGVVGAVEPDGVVIEVGGVGLLLSCTPATVAALRVGEPARLATSLVVREDSLTLFGFLTEDERTVFELLRTATGVGPKLALAMLAVHGPDDVRRAVATEDLAALSLVPGIGRKGAQRIVLEMKDKLGDVVGAHLGRPIRLPDRRDSWREQLRGGLAGLGWAPREVEDALGAVAGDAEAALAAGADPDVALLLKRSLQLLSRV
jgi:Holliday junction DNA helicase RuvA